MAGSQHGVRLEPEDLIGAAHAAGRPAAERTTLYELRERHEPREAAAAWDKRTAAGGDGRGAARLGTARAWQNRMLTNGGAADGPNLQANASGAGTRA